MNRKSFLTRTASLILGYPIAQWHLVSSKWPGSKGRRFGPYFGNGFRNGWVDQTSAVIWTRLTQTPELNATGQSFFHVSREDHESWLRHLKDEHEIHKIQIPQGLTLADLEGACPGTEGEVKLTFRPIHQRGRKHEVKWTAVDPNMDHTVQWKLDDLLPGTVYEVTLQCRKSRFSRKTDTISGTFTTPPAPSVDQAVRFCVVTCHSYNWKDGPEGHTIYRSMLTHRPDFYVHTGDVEYYDAPDPWAMTEKLMRFKWNRLFALPNQRRFYTKVTSYFMKDDHDTLANDCSPGDSYGSVSFDRGMEIFDKEQFPSTDRTYKTVRWGKSLQVWFLEGRNYRSRNDMPDGPEKTVLGKEQKKWLFDTVTSSDAPFKVIVSPTPILGPDKPGKNDNLANPNFQHEGDEIREFFGSQKNLYLCNGDRHWQYATHWQNIDLWEFGCGAGSDLHPMHWDSNDVRPEHEFLRVKGGYLLVEAGDGTISFNHCDVEGNVVFQKRFDRE